MTSQAKYASIIFTLIGVIIGALVFSNFNDSFEPKVYSYPSRTPGVTPSADRQITTLRDMNEAFVDIAKAVNPTVVTVFTEKVLRMRGFEGPFAFDPFREFFGEEFFGPRQRQRQAPGREFKQQGLGSGVIVSEEGYILTNNHVVAQADSIYIRMLDGKTIPAKVIGTDPRTDLAVIKVEGSNMPTIKLGSSANLRVGEWVLAVGSPLSPDLANTVTQGIVSAKGRSNVRLAEYEDFIQTDAAINPGNSGGALVNLDGELVGINTAIASGSGGFQGIGFAVPIDMARNVMDALIKHGKVVRGWLGVSIQDLNEKMAKTMDLKDTQGVVVAGVGANSPAAKAGIQEGDVIRELSGKPVKNTAELRNEVAATAPGTTVELGILRDGKEKSVSVKLGELPADGQNPMGESDSSLEQLLGFVVSTLDRDLAERFELDPDLEGVVVTELDRSSSAAREGLRTGDVIRSVNRKRIRNVAEFNGVLKGLKHGDTVLLNIVRGDAGLFVAFAV